MRTVLMRAATVVVLAVVAAPSGLAAQMPEPSAGLEQEVRALNGTLRELVELIRRQLESDNAALLMQRVGHMTRRIAPLEQELQTARAEERRLQNQFDGLELMASSVEDQIVRRMDEGEVDAEEGRGLMEQQQSALELQREQLEGKLWAAKQRVIDLEQVLELRHAEIESWEGRIDQALDVP